MRILVVEDEKVLAETLKKGLEREGFAVDYLTDGEIAKRRISLYNKEYDLVVLDWMLPSKDGLQVCREIRELKIKIPILMLTARSGVDDKISALNEGADDYLSKPFSFEELEARIRALLRRPTQFIYSALEVGNIKLDASKHQVFVGDKEIKLTAKEFSLLEYLMRNNGIVVSRDQILDHLWGFDFDSFTNIVEVHMKNLRTKLENGGSNSIETIRGAGYLIKND